MDLGLYLFRSDHTFHISVCANDERGTESAHILAAVHRLLAPDTKLIHQLVVCVRYKRKRQIIFLDKFLMRRGRIYTHAYHLVAGVDKGLVIVSQAACLRGASRSGILGIKIQGNFLTGKIAASDLFTVLVCA